ncbi:sugar O-acetyltransferase [Lentisphaerota bacterium ZTH]|nr:sugar O-acetyltransferase [Lentisphaerota bacterium]WET06511.1 sugar O-acetyltransferase [Lentisphaerota bacterium ZTH]
MAKSEKEKMLAGELYDASDQQLAEERLIARRFCRKYNSILPEAEAERAKALKEMFPEAGEDLYIEPPFRFDYGCNIKFGKNVYMNFRCIILDSALVTIGDNVMIAPNVQLYTASHPVNAAERISGPELAAPITIGNNVWIGGGAIILPGVTIGDNTTIGAGSVVTKDIPANVSAAGNPCKVIREL